MPVLALPPTLLAGAVADRLIDAGATAVVGETLEWLGAEHALRHRCVRAEVGRKVVQAVHRPRRAR